MELRYGINPQQLVATAVPVEPGSRPVRVVNGSPSYINLLDALNGWQLAREASRVLGRPAAASFKHVSPAGAAVAGPVDEVTAELYGVDRDGVGALTSAYLRARDADPKSSYGDFAAVSHPVDAELAELLTRVVCDGVIAPGYAPGTVGTLSRKKSGRFLVMEAEESFTPPGQEAREVFGMRLTQQRDDVPLSPALLDDLVCGELTTAAAEDLLLGLAVLRHTQSNSVCYVRGGATLGIGAGRQSRVDCTRLAGAKTDTWWLRRHPAVRALAFRPGVRRQDRINWQIRFVEGDLTPDERARLSGALSVPAPDLTDEQRAGWLGRVAKVAPAARRAGPTAPGACDRKAEGRPDTGCIGVIPTTRRACVPGAVGQAGLSPHALAELTGVAFASDGALPFRDNVDHAHRHGVTSVAEPGGSIRSTDVEDACREHGITLARTGLRLFHH